MTINDLSEKQKEILSFIKSNDYALICDGSVRSGKTMIMSMAFLLWAMSSYDRTNFAMCGKTVQSAERNILKPLMEIDALKAVFSMSYKVSTRVLTVKCGSKVNWFYFFGGKDESSYMLIQGVTLAGILFDEVALMPKSFVDQALARTISFEHPKYFFNCNPESPSHYFYNEWILEPKPNTKHIHFQLEDNPIMTPEMIEQTKALYSGVFYDRYIRGLWVVAEGLIYPMFDAARNIDNATHQGRYYVSCDYGIKNPFSAHLWCVEGGIAYCLDEYYHDGRKSAPRTDEEHYKAIEELVGNRQLEHIVIDPSASSMIETIYRHGKFSVKKANNDVIGGIGAVSTLLQAGRLKYNEKCVNNIKEFGLYSWDMDVAEDKPIKENDHAMDDNRYFVSSILIDELEWVDWSKKA